MDREGWYAAVHRVTKSLTWLSNWTELNVTHLCATNSWDKELTRNYHFYTAYVIKNILLWKKLLGGLSSVPGDGKWSRSVVSDSLWPHGLWPTRLLRPWDFPGASTGVGCHFRWSSQLRGRTLVSRIAGRCFNLWATREARLVMEFLYILVQAPRPTVGRMITANIAFSLWVLTYTY